MFLHCDIYFVSSQVISCKELTCSILSLIIPFSVQFPFTFLYCTFRSQNRSRPLFSVLGILPPRKIPPGTIYHGIFPQGMFPPEKNECFFGLQLRCFGLQLASLALGLRTLVETGSRQRHIFHSQASLEGNVPEGNNRDGTFRGKFSGEEYSGHLNFN